LREGRVVVCVDSGSHPRAPVASRSCLCRNRRHGSPGLPRARGDHSRSEVSPNRRPATGVVTEADSGPDRDDGPPDAASRPASDAPWWRRLTVIVISVAVLVAVGLAPVYPSKPAATTIAIAGLATLTMSAVLIPPTLLALPWLWAMPRMLFDLVGATLRPRSEAEVRAELDDTLARLRNDDLREQFRAVTHDMPRALQFAFARGTTRIGQPAAEGLVAVWFKISAALAGVIFLLVWTLIYLLIWSWEANAFNLRNPRLGEFLYIAASGVLGGTPEGVEAMGSFSQTAVTLELLSAFVLASGFAAALRRG
jgi:hypothetical protein